jgi:hypothetical protein
LVKQLRRADDKPELAQSPARNLVEYQDCYAGIAQMGAIYHHDICRTIVEVLNASVDLVLAAYDGSQFYRIFRCASDAFSHERLDAAMLRDCEARLKRARRTD